jgi:glycosyltransferase involved in cell wall biosynthesis
VVDPPERATPDRNTTDRNTEPHSDAGRGVGDAGAPRIVFAAHALTRATGGSRAGADILAALLATGRPVTLLSPDRPQLPATLDGEVLGRPRWLRAPPELRFPAWRGSARLISWLRSVAGWLLRTARGGPRRLSLRRRLRVEPPRLVVFNGLPWPGAFMTRLLAPLHPSLMVVHSPPDSVRYFAARDAHFTPAAVARSMRPFDHYVFVSARVRDAWQAELGIPPEACTVVHNCCREDEALAARARGRAEARRSLGWPEDAFVALCLASVSERKGQDVLLAAWHGVLRDAPGSLALVVGDDRSAWARRCASAPSESCPGACASSGSVTTCSCCCAPPT